MSPDFSMVWRYLLYSCIIPFVVPTVVHGHLGLYQCDIGLPLHYGVLDKMDQVSYVAISPAFWIMDCLGQGQTICGSL